MLLSVIVPCYNEEENISDFYTALTDSLGTVLSERSLEMELIYVDDGSTDRTAERVKALTDMDSRVRLLSFSRNFGKESAIYAGLENAAGDLLVIMDSDLQDPPVLLPDMLSGILDEGYDSVATRRVNRKGEPPIRSFFARRFYSLINRIS